MVSSGVELDPGMVLRAYRMGAFPMADAATGSISWYAPDPRAVIDLKRMSLPRSLRTLIRRGMFQVRWDTAFREVIEGCASRPETWISPEIIRTYEDLFRNGWAHSVECWRNDRLVGGLYGVAIGGAFFGESMFSGETNASKVALAALAERMRARGFVLLDTQFMTPHLERFGAVEISRKEYLRRLQEALQRSCVLVP